MSDLSPVEAGTPERDSTAATAAGGGDGEGEETSDLESQEDFVHESVELPDWVPVVFGLILIAIAVAAIVLG